MRLQLIKNFLINILFLCSLCGQATEAKHIYPEKTYQDYWCKSHNGRTEYRLNDGTRIDCLTTNYAIEFDFANKWAESIGQSLHYSISTNRNAGIVLIIENEKKDAKYLKRLQNIASYYKIKIWTITPEELSRQCNCNN